MDVGLSGQIRPFDCEGGTGIKRSFSGIEL